MSYCKSIGGDLFTTVSTVNGKANGFTTSIMLSILISSNNNNSKTVPKLLLFPSLGLCLKISSGETLSVIKFYVLVTTTYAFCQPATRGFTKLSLSGAVPLLDLTQMPLQFSLVRKCRIPIKDKHSRGINEWTFTREGFSLFRDRIGSGRRPSLVFVAGSLREIQRMDTPRKSV